MTARPRPSLLIPALSGVLVAVIALLIVVLMTSDDDPVDTTTTAVATTTTSTIAATSSTEGTTTTAATTSTGVSTTVAGSTGTVTNTEITGSPGPNLTDVRIGDHDGFVRIVFDLTGDGNPMYIIGYEQAPFLATSGDPVPVEGAAFLVVHLSPARRYDIDTLVPTYTGDLVLEPGFDPIEQIVFIDDFEAAMQWVIGLDAEHPFTVEVLQDPLRVVVDVEK